MVALVDLAEPFHHRRRCRSHPLCGVALVAWAAWLSGAAAVEPPSDVHREGTYFEARIPAGWVRQTAAFGLSAEEKKVYGVTLKGPSLEESVTMAAHYYAPGNLLDRTAEKFIRGHSAVSRPGAPVPAVPKAPGGTVGGLKAELFCNISIRHDGSRRLDAPRIEIWEGFAVVPLASGYYVLRYSAPRAAYAQWLPVFEEFIATFRPLLK